MARRRLHRRAAAGLTLLELIIVIAIIGLAWYVLRSGLRIVTRADLTEDATDLEAFLRRASQLAIERGELHRVVLDLDDGHYVVEVCQGQAAIERNAQLRPDEDEVKRAVEKGQEKLRDLPQDALAVGDPDEATRRATAIAGHHINDRTCTPVTTGRSGLSKRNADDHREAWVRQLASSKFKEIWVQHREDSTTKGQAAVYFFPNGSAEKAVIEIVDGSATQTVLVFGLTGHVQRKSGRLANVEDHMMRNALGDRDKPRGERP